MASRLPHRSLACLLFLLMAFVPQLAAQSALYVQSGDKAYLVRKVRAGRAYVEKDGKLVAVTPGRAALGPVPEYLPAFISVSNLRVSSSHLEYTTSAAEINHTFNLAADFRSSYAMQNVFLVLELNTANEGKLIFFYEVGDLLPGKAQSLDIHVPTQSGIGASQYQMHLFTDGAEVFHSNHPMPYRESMLDKMVAKRIAGVKDSGPKPFFGPTPEYPKALRKTGVKGEALVSIRITRTGAVLDPVVKRASDPAFGEAAVTAVRLWRFLPKVANGRAVEMTADLPFVFDPEEEKKKG